MATRADPSGTTALTRRLVAQIRGRFREFARACADLIGAKDAAGLGGAAHVGQVLNAETPTWRFLTNPQKLESFSAWTEAHLGLGVLERLPSGEPWISQSTGAAYRKGLLSGFEDARGNKLRGGFPAFFAGSKAEFLRQRMGDPETAAQLRVISTRAFEDLKGLSSYAATQLNRILANGILRGMTPKQVAREMTKKVDGLTRHRAVLIARTEMVHAAAEGTLDALKQLGVERVGLWAEWSTAKDHRVCKSCGVLEGVVFTLSEARGLIPRHPMCRCAWLPATQVKRLGRRKRALKAAVKSLRLETGSRTKNPGKASAWAGKEL